ncbi:putative colanic acid biosynthesis acetyltransferase [Parabacteroides distasonis]|nr:putative colanic acid biosynthesis acetyltransferase [Parabacteroides distasonis]
MRNEEGIYINRIPKLILFKRLLWEITSFCLFKPFPTKVFRKWNLFILKAFGANIGKQAVVYNSCRIQCPWNLEMKFNSCIGPHTIVENDVLVFIGENATISQYSYICTSSHDIYHKHHDLTTSPIYIYKDAWVAAGAFIGMGVTIGEGAVVGARSSVFKDVEPWTVVGGNPAKFIKKRIIEY